MIISLIAALTLNRVIGNKNAIPWNIPNDLLWFKKHTINKPVIMGSKTFNTIGKKPLSNRLNIILSHHPKNNTSTDDTIWVTDPTQALLAAGKKREVMVIGGGEVYRALFTKATRLYLTHIYAIIDGDTYFPNYLSNQWKSIFIEYHYDLKNTTNKYCYCFEILERC